MSNPIVNVEPVDMPQHGRVIPLESLRMSSDRDKQLKMFAKLENHWMCFDPARLRQMQQIAGVLKQQQSTLHGQNLVTLEALYAKFCGGES
jgi:hypothetical protein